MGPGRRRHLAVHHQGMALARRGSAQPHLLPCPHGNEGQQVGTGRGLQVQKEVETGQGAAQAPHPGQARALVVHHRLQAGHGGQQRRLEAAHDPGDAGLRPGRLQGAQGGNGMAHVAQCGQA